MAYRVPNPLIDVGRGISPADGALLYAFEVGTTTPKATYSNFALSTANAHPIVADANGRFSDIFTSDNVDLRLNDKDGTLIWGPVTVYDPTNSVSGLAASNVTVTDAGGYFDDSDVEAVLDQIGSEFQKGDRAEAISENRNYSNDATLINPIFRNFRITHEVIASSGGTLTVDLALGNSFVTTLTENVTTLTISSVPSTNYITFELRVIQDGAGGAYTMTQPASVLSPGGTAPTITTSNDAIDRLTYVSIDGGTTWLLDFSQAYA